METKSKQEQVVERMIQLRDQRDALKAKFAAEDKKLEESYLKGEAWLLNELQTTGAQSMRFECGTVTQSTTMRANIGDWDALSKFIVENNLVDMLQKRISTTTLKEYMSSEGKEVPPGVAITYVRCISIRRK